MGDTFSSLKGLEGLYAQMVQEQPEQEDESRHAAQIPDPYGVQILDDTGMQRRSIFVTEFAPEDVEYFENALGIISPEQFRKDELKRRISAVLVDWCHTNPDKCPYEPFLWAIKQTDGYIGSTKSNIKRQPWRLTDVGDALAFVWDKRNQYYDDAIKNIILRWDWYQPVRLTLYLYQSIPEMEDEEIEQCIRTKWLHKAQFCLSAFYCLCEKRRKRDNIRELMRFVSRDIQKDSSSATTPITYAMRNKMKDYLNALDEEAFQFAKSFYEEELYACSKNAREFFDRLFYGASADDEVYHLIGRWRKAASESDKDAVRLEIRAMFDKNQSVDVLIKHAAKSKSENLTDLMISMIQAQKTEYNTQFLMKAILANAPICKTYENYIMEGYQKWKNQLDSETGFLFGCAYCKLCEPQLLSKLFRIFYFDGVGIQSGWSLFFPLKHEYDKAYQEEATLLAEECACNPSSARRLVSNCSKIFRQSNSNLFPTAFDRICKYLIRLVEEHRPNAVGYATSVLDLYERIVSVRNRDKYQDDLMRLYYSADTTPMQNVKSRVCDLIHVIYG